MSRVRINLLDWRDATRVRRTRGFWLTVVLAAAAGVGMALLASLWLQWQLSLMAERDHHVQQAMTQLEATSREMADLDRQLALLDQEEALLSRLQDQRRQTLDVVNGLAATLVNGVRYDRVERRDDALILEGEAVDSARLVEQLRALERVPTFLEPQLSRVGAQHGRQRFVVQLQLASHAVERPRP
ncbi:MULTISPECIES: PilN domain-containing protein [Halomonas]|uniref:PilN domain-containing protein n=1 Tax=Halomonas TaxID=2745 RepID=UPI001C956398|nr:MULTISPECIES: PilN domain-containing protein [Halomonas]MBY6209583.1 hypothetical protein [Halomonas sp. DP3Y7-2]MBY6226764.1 hypothetical protein [Halomonas sp. DP3Y7-1]MCA0915488.1 hypothetical protein [Halomonas denitrificans]